jgi:hypothetical protein
MEPGLGFEFVRKMSWCELGPALMWRSISFTCAQVRELCGLRTQRMVIRRKRGRKLLDKRGVRRTVDWCNANYRLGDGALKA